MHRGKQDAGGVKGQLQPCKRTISSDSRKTSDVVQEIIDDEDKCCGKDTPTQGSRNICGNRRNESVFRFGCWHSLPP